MIEPTDSVTNYFSSDTHPPDNSFPYSYQPGPFRQVCSYLLEAGSGTVVSGAIPPIGRTLLESGRGCGVGEMSLMGILERCDVGV